MSYDSYTPRRANLTRWLKDAPPYILDCFDDKISCDCYTVFFVPDKDRSDKTYCGTLIDYLGMSGAPTHPQGISMWGDTTAAQCANFRYENGHYRIAWLDLPEHVRNHVIARYTEE